MIAINPSAKDNRSNTIYIFMANLRRNHQAQSRGLQTTFRLVIFLIIAVFALVGGYIWFNGIKVGPPDIVAPPPMLRTYLPNSNGDTIHHTYYSLSYLENHELAEWIAYPLTKQQLQMPNVEREDYFSPDDKIKTGSAVHADYSGSGYTRGHLAPAGDMAFDDIAMKESFFMSNMAPQIKEFNNGVWKELEENVRDWTYKAETLYIIAGPILQNSIKKIGKQNKVTVPSAFYKVLLDYTGDEKKGIAFVIPNKLSTERLETYMVSIDSIESLTGLDFFNDMINDGEEEKLESSINPSLWKVSDKRYELRINKWNFE
jgi:endonuclease G